MCRRLLPNQDPDRTTMILQDLSELQRGNLFFPPILLME